MAVTAAQLNQLYLAYFGRPADFDGLTFYTANASATIQSVAAAFSASPESQALYGATFNAASINAIYRALFNRDAEPAGLTYWSTEVAAGRLTPAFAAYGILIGAQNADKTAVDNKLTVAAAFTAALDTAAEITGYSGAAAAASARAFLATVTSDAATLTAAQTGLNTAVSNAVNLGNAGIPGTTFTLTTGVDLFTGASANDTFIAAQGGASITLQAGDTLNGGEGVDTLQVTHEGAGAGLTAASISNVEVISVRNVGTGTLTVNGAAITGETGYIVDRSTKAVNLLSIGTADVTVKGEGTTVSPVRATVGSTAVTDALIVNFTGGSAAGTGLTFTEAAVDFNADGDTTDEGEAAVDLDGDGTANEVAENANWTTVTINSTGGANVSGPMVLGNGKIVTATINATTALTTGSITGFDAASTAATLTATGAGAVTVGALDANLDILDGSKLTGALTATIGAVTQTVTGGTANDVITTGGALTTGSVNAGTGTDRLVLAATTDINSTTLGAKYTGFEVLQVQNGVTGDLDFLSGITAVRINDTAAAATVAQNLTAEQAAAIQALDLEGAFTIGVKNATSVGQLDTVKITVSDGDTTLDEANTATGADPTLLGVETLELIAVDQVLVAGLTNAASLTKLVLSGAGTQSVTSGAITPIVNTVIDGSAATGALTINFSGVVGAATTNAVSFIGGTKGDTITTTGGAADVVNGKAGYDVITVTKDAASSGFATVQSEVTATADADSVTGFVTTENKFDYNGALTNGTGTSTNGITAATEVVTSATTFAAGLADGSAGNAIVFIAQGNLTAAQGATALGTLAGAGTAANAAAFVTALLGTGGALNGTIANLDSVLGTTDAALLVLDDGTNSAVLRITNTDTTTANTLTSAEVALVGVFNATAALAAADFI